MTLTLEELKQNLDTEKTKFFKSVHRKALKKGGTDPVIVKELLGNNLMIKLFYEYQKALSLYSGKIFGAIKSKNKEDERPGAYVILPQNQNLKDLFKSAGISKDELNKTSGLKEPNEHGMPLTVEDLEKAHFVLSLLSTEQGFDDKMGLDIDPDGAGYRISSDDRLAGAKPIAFSKQTLYRGISRLSPDVFLKYIKTKHFRLDELESWTRDYSSAAGYGDRPDYGIIFTVSNPELRGSSIEDESVYSGEREVILGSGVIRTDPYYHRNLTDQSDTSNPDASKSIAALKQNKVPKLNTIADVEKYVMELEEKRAERDYKDKNNIYYDVEDYNMIPRTLYYHMRGRFVSDAATPEYKRKMLSESKKIKINKKYLMKLIKESIRKQILL
jgi:hypothetical protein